VLEEISGVIDRGDRDGIGCVLAEEECVGDVPQTVDLRGLQLDRSQFGERMDHASIGL
jgi:hypothetical protein